MLINRVQYFAVIPRARPVFFERVIATRPAQMAAAGAHIELALVEEDLSRNMPIARRIHRNTCNAIIWSRNTPTSPWEQSHEVCAKVGKAYSRCSKRDQCDGPRHAASPAKLVCGESGHRTAQRVASDHQG